MSQEALRKSLEIYKGLVEVSCLINSIAEHDELLRAILDVARRVMNAEAASIFLVDESTGDLRLEMDSRGFEEYERPGIVIPKGLGIAGWVFEHGQPLLIPDAYKDARFYSDPDKKSGFTTRSMLCVPLQQEDKNIGVLAVLNPVGKDSFEEGDKEGFSAYADLTATAIDKLRGLELERQQERVRRDISIAADIQRDLLNHAIPSNLKNVRFAAHNESAAMVGGDFYGVFKQENEAVDFVIGDVSGKGIPASLLMSRILSALPFVLESESGPACALAALNRKLSETMIRGMFITAISGRMFHSKRLVQLSSAGHCHPIHLKASGEAVSLPLPSSLPLGISRDCFYDEKCVELGIGDKLIFHTDGLTESRRADGADMFGDVLMKTLQGEGGSPDEILSRILKAEKLHRGGSDLLDDLTVMVCGFE
jgi:sigma-B regulation protein RsbU (phosphoserine phosphatase)